jgi:hypothetical protein
MQDNKALLKHLCQNFSAVAKFGRVVLCPDDLPANITDDFFKTRPHEGLLLFRAFRFHRAKSVSVLFLYQIELKVPRNSGMPLAVPENESTGRTMVTRNNRVSRSGYFFLRSRCSIQS